MKTNKTTRTLAAFAAFFLAHAASAECTKANFKGCFSSPDLSFSLPAVTGVTPDMIAQGPASKPELTKEEKDSKVVFCSYVRHIFSSTGSAKFDCVRTNQAGVFYDEKGNLVPEAVRATNDGDTIVVNGSKIKVEDGYLLDEKGQAITKTAKDGTVKPVQGDVLKVKYFVNKSEESGGKRGERIVHYAGMDMKIPNAFENSPVLENKRWHEVFNETAVTRLLWSMGQAADIMLPMEKVVCIGCTSHPWGQNQAKQGNAGNGSIAIFNLAVIERKFDAKKLGEGWSFDEAVSARSSWSERIRTEYDVMALTYTLFNYFNAINLQNRIVCLSKDEPCTRPLPFVQDVGSTFGADGKGLFAQNPRGDLAAFSKDNAKVGIFSDVKSCTLARPLTAASPRISNAGLAEFKNRAASLTDDVLMSIFRVSRFDKMEPGVTASLKNDPEAVYRAWTAEVRKKINQITAIQSCP